jgi:acyl-CoA hydrolase
MTEETATLEASHTGMTEFLLPNDTNNLGRALGGAVLHWMDLCGAMAAMRFAGRQVVTAAIDHVGFSAPIDLGEIVVVEAYVFATGTSSIDVRVEVSAENPRTDERRRTASSFLTFVALDETGEPTPAPELSCPTAEERELRETARAARQAQLETLAERIAADADGGDDDG